MVKSHHDIAAEASERYPNILLETTLGISASLFGCGLCTVETSRLGFVYKLTGSRSVLKDPGAVGTTALRSRAVVTLAIIFTVGNIVIYITR